MKKDKRSEEKKQADAFVQALNAFRTGQSYRQIAKDLNADGYKTDGGAQWSGNAVSRMLADFKMPLKDTPPSEPLKPKFPMTIQMERYRDGKDGKGFQVQAPSTEYHDVVIETQEEWDTMKRATEEIKKELAERRSKPRDWRRSLDFDMVQINAWDSLALAGKDTWHRSVLPLIVQQIEETGKVPMDLIDAIEGQPDVKGQLRRVFFGMLRALAKLRETEWALRVKHEPADPAVKADFEAWKRSKMVDLGSPEAT